LGGRDVKTLSVRPWEDLAADAAGRRTALFEHLRTWAARLHVKKRSAVSTRTTAALDALARPFRSAIAARDQDATSRDRAEAAADDLWDAVAAVWSLVRSVDKSDAPALEHVVAELSECGRWLARYPVDVARHDQAISDLFQEATT